MVVFRAPRPGEDAALTELCLRSKAVHGYDAEFMRKCRAELTVDTSPADRWFLVADDGDRPVGFVEMSFHGGVAELDKLFIEPRLIGGGVGKALFARAVDAARARQTHVISIDADPGAAAFYEAQGATIVGEVASGSIPGRVLPRLEFIVRSP